LYEIKSLFRKTVFIIPAMQRVFEAMSIHTLRVMFSLCWPRDIIIITSLHG